MLVTRSYTKRPSPATYTRLFSKRANLLAKKNGKYNSSDPFIEDSAAQLAKDFKDDPQGLEHHFSQKEFAINSLKDSEETGELEDIPQEKLNS